MATISDLYETLFAPDVYVVEPALLDTPTLSEFMQRDRAEHDQSNRTSIQIVTDDLISHLRALVDVEAVNTLREEYAHNSINSQQQTFWEDNVIPIVLELVSQDETARSILTQAYGAVRDLGIEIQTASEILRSTGWVCGVWFFSVSLGSQIASEVAMKKLQAALTKLKEFIARAESADASLISSFASDSGKLFPVIGEEAGNFVKRKQKIRAKLDKLYDIRDRKLDECAQCQAEVDLCARVIDATQEHLSHKEDENAENNRLIEELHKMNAEDESTIEKIAADTIAFKNRKSFWLRRKNEISCEMYSDLEAEINYHRNLILARMKQVREIEERNERVKWKIADLSQVYDHYNSLYELAKMKDECLKYIYPVSSLDKLQREIDRLLKSLEELSKQQVDFENQLAISASSLAYIQKYSQRMWLGATAYSKIVSILKGIKATVECDIELLSGTNADILIAVNRLAQCGGLLTKYAISSLLHFENVDEKP